jgi:hypothetical protein
MGSRRDFCCRWLLLLGCHDQGQRAVPNGVRPRTLVEAARITTLGVIGESTPTPNAVDTDTQNAQMQSTPTPNEIERPAQSSRHRHQTKGGGVHYAASVARFVADHELTSGETLVLLTLWSRTRDPFAERPSVSVSYEELRCLTGLAPTTVRDATRRLQRIEALVKCGSRRGAGTRYELRRPEHRPEDLELAPFEPSAAESVAAQVVEGLAQADLLRPHARPRRQPESKPSIRPSDISAALESMAGLSAKSLPFSAKRGDCSAVVAAQRFIAARGLSLAAFRGLCERLRGQVAGDPAHVARVFERGAEVARLLGEPRTETAADTLAVQVPEQPLTEDQIRWRKLAETVP